MPAFETSSGTCGRTSGMRPHPRDSTGALMKRPHFVASPHAIYRTRREFLGRTGSGFGLLALASLLGQETAQAAPDRTATSAPAVLHPLAARKPHFQSPV